MSSHEEFEMRDFLPYLLNLAAEECSMGFQAHYRNRYGMLRTEWRVLFHLGRYGQMTATEIGRRARLHKTKISRAVAALERRRFLARATLPEDRRAERLTLTPAGRRAYDDLSAIARDYDRQLMSAFDETERAVLKSCLQRLARA